MGAEVDVGASDLEKVAREIGRHRARLNPSSQSELQVQLADLLMGLPKPNPERVAYWAAVLSATPLAREQVASRRMAGAPAARRAIAAFANLLEQLREANDAMPADAVDAIDHEIGLINEEGRDRLRRQLSQSRRRPRSFNGERDSS